MLKTKMHHFYLTAATLILESEDVLAELVGDLDAVRFQSENGCFSIDDEDHMMIAIKYPGYLGWIEYVDPNAH